MKRVTLVTALLLLCWGLSAQNTMAPSREGLQISPDTLHVYFFGCSPHLDLVTIVNPYDELVYIERIYAENFRIDCLLEGNNIAQTGTILLPFDTLYLEVYASPIAGKDTYGHMIIETDIGDYSLVLFYETNVSVDEQGQRITLFPNPANESITISDEQLGQISVFNATGQKINEFFTDDKTLTIPTSTYPNGVYFIKTNNRKGKSFVVAH